MSAAPKILVLAGRRSATLDPLAERFGVSHKAMVPVRGEAMIGRVLRICEAAFPGETLYVSIEEFALIQGEPTVARLSGEGRLAAIPSCEHIVDSIVAASGTTGFPLLVTTADNVLMTPESLREMHAMGERGGADAIVGMAERKDILACHPDGQRRFYEFKDGGFSNCNMFWLGSPKSLAATESFRHGGQFAKRPERIIKAFGILNLIRFRLGWWTLARAFHHISKRFGVVIVPLVFADGRVAIDVDNDRTHGVAEEVLARTGG